MEVRDQRVDGREAIRRRDVQVAPAARGPAPRGRLQDPDARRADRHDPATLAPGLGQRRPRRPGDLEPLAMDAVLVDEVALERPERVQADVQRDRRTPDAGGRESFEQARREMEPGGRRGGGARWPRVDGLVPLCRGAAVVDVGRQRQLTGIAHDFVRVAVDAHRARSVAEPLPHLDRVAAAERQPPPHRNAA